MQTKTSQTMDVILIMKIKINSQVRTTINKNFGNQNRQCGSTAVLHTWATAIKMVFTMSL